MNLPLKFICLMTRMQSHHKPSPGGLRSVNSDCQFSTFCYEYNPKDLQGQVPQVTGQYTAAQIPPEQRGQRPTASPATHLQPLPLTVSTESAHTVGIDVGNGLGFEDEDGLGFEDGDGLGIEEGDGLGGLGVKSKVKRASHQLVMEPGAKLTSSLGSK